MDDALSTLPLIKPNQGKSRWVRPRGLSNEKSRARNPGAGITLTLALLLGGCAAQGPREPAPPAVENLRGLDSERRFITVPTGNHPCDVPNIYYEDESLGLRQLIVDWRALGDRYTYTLPNQGREALVERIEKSGQGCPTPYRIESREDGNRVDISKSPIREFAFVLYWLDQGQIYFKVSQYKFDPEASSPRGMLSRVSFNFTPWKQDLETNWGYKPYNGPVALPQVAYRIDEQRYFEVVPQEYFACARARLYYVDKGRGIRSLVSGWDNLRNGDFILDAANLQYLVGPIIDSSSGCQTGSGSSLKCAARLSYSNDAGRTWRFNIPKWIGGGDVYMSGRYVYYAGAKASVDMLVEGYDKDLWSDGLLTDFPKPIKAPLDSKLRCNRNDME